MRTQTTLGKVNAVLAAVNAEQAQADATIVVRLGDLAFTRGELRAAFERVQNRENWKAAIFARVTFASERDRMATHLAVRFFAGCACTMTQTSDAKTWIVTAVGYYAAVGA